MFVQFPWGEKEPILMNKNKALNFYEKENCSNHIYAKQKNYSKHQPQLLNFKREKSICFQI